MKFNVGNKVKVKNWDVLVKEFGLDNYKDVITPYGFLFEMKEHCGQIVTINRLINEEAKDTCAYKIKESKMNYTFDECVLEATTFTEKIRDIANDMENMRVELY